MQGMDGFLRRSLILLCVVVPLGLSSAAPADDYLKQARAILEYYLADNTPDPEFRHSLDPTKAEEALALVDKHLALHTQDDQVRAWSALAYDALGRPEDAWPELETALDAGLGGAAWLDLAGD